MQIDILFIITSALCVLPSSDKEEAAPWARSMGNDTDSDEGSNNIDKTTKEMSTMSKRNDFGLDINPARGSICAMRDDDEGGELIVVGYDQYSVDADGSLESDTDGDSVKGDDCDDGVNHSPGDFALKDCDQSDMGGEVRGGPLDMNC